MKKIWELFITFAKIGLFTFGGGYAMIGVIEDICVEKNKWISHDDMMNMTVLAESTPGPIAINCATFVGYRQAKLAGAIASTLGVVLPSFTIIYIISMFLDNFLEYTIVANAFMGIKAGVGILIIRAAANMIKKMEKTPLSVAVLIVSSIIVLLVDILSVRISSVTLILVAAILGVAVYSIKLLSAKRGGEGK